MPSDPPDTPKRPNPGESPQINYSSVPDEVGGVGAEGGLGCEGERAIVEIGELEVLATGKDGLGDVGLSHADAEVVIDGPEACIEEIVCAGR